MSILSQNSLLLDALSCAARGWAVLPLRGKLPAISKENGGSGYLDATTNTQQIAEWWAMYPWANIGVASRASSLVIVDVDPRKGGDEHLLDLEAKYGPLPDTIEAITGGGGRHIYLKAPAEDRLQRKADALGRGIDLPNYVVAPPSIHPDTGRAYLWEASSDPDDVPLAACPDWILRLAEKHPATPHTYTPIDESGVSWDDILRPYGWISVNQKDKATYWRRPGKDAGGWSATTNYIPGRLYLFTTSGAPLSAGRPYSKVQAYALLNGCDCRAAARELGIALPHRMTFLGLKSLSAARSPAPPVLRIGRQP